MKKPYVAHAAALLLFLTAACYPQIYTEGRTQFDVEERKPYDVYVVSPFPGTSVSSTYSVAPSGSTTINIYNVAPYSSSQPRQSVALPNYPTYYPSNPSYNNGYYGNSLVYGTTYYGGQYAYPVGSYGSARLVVGSPGFGLGGSLYGYNNGYNYQPSNRNRNQNMQRNNNAQRQYRQQYQQNCRRGWRRH